MNVTVDAAVIGPIIGHCLNDLADDTCCPRCCATCYAIGKLIQTGQLDTIIESYAAASGGTWAWWDGHRVDRSWLGRKWSRNDCHAPMGHHTTKAT